jgi:hypothetical protein
VESAISAAEYRCGGMANAPYKPSTSSRIRAFFLTDRNGQTLASTLGFFSIVRWWARSRAARIKLRLRPVARQKNG